MNFNSLKGHFKKVAADIKKVTTGKGFAVGAGAAVGAMALHPLLLGALAGAGIGHLVVDSVKKPRKNGPKH
jgi:hypothetical protein